MQVVEQHPYVDQILSPIEGENPMGESLMDDPAMEFLDNEIMKVGSLAHTGIEWSKVESESLRLLADQSKDLKVLGFLLLCLQRGGSGERFALSLYLLGQVLDSWWEEAWPYPGERGKRARKMLFNQILQRAAGEVSGLSFDGGVGDGRQYCLDRIAALNDQAASRELPADLLFDLRRGVEKLPAAGEAQPEPAAVSPAGESNKPRESSGNSGSQPAATRATASLGNLSLDPGNERATRQSLLKVADLLNELNPEDPLGYQMRRYAIWQNISALPPTRDGVKTDLAAVSADRVAEYRDALAKQPGQALWQRIEQSLSVSPFWLEGHWLSAQVARALDLDDCAEAIRVAVKGFMERLPDLEKLTFNDGTAFFPQEVMEWLHSAPAGGGVSAGASSWEQAYEQARELAVQKDLSAAMKLMDAGLAEAREPRSRFYWRLMSARLLRDSGLESLASQQMKDLKEQTQALALEDWEPGLMATLDRLS